MTALPTKRTVKMNVKDITLVPEKATGWWCQINREEYYHLLTEERSKVAGKLGKCGHYTSYASTVIGKVSGKKLWNWRGTSFGFREYFHVWPLYENTTPEIKALYTKEEYTAKWHWDKEFVDGVGHVLYRKRNTQNRIIAKDNKYDRLYSLPAWLKFYLIDSLPVGSDK
jgi:hypothetical protein